jgi:hypothetical protein
MPVSSNTKHQIENNLRALAAEPLRDAASALWATLGYKSGRTFKLRGKADFREKFDHAGRFDEKLAHWPLWKEVEFLFQLNDDDINAINSTLSLFESANRVDNQDIRSYVFFAIRLTDPSQRSGKFKDKDYTRTELSDITRALNRLLPMPALVLFRHGDTLTLAAINRRLHKREESRDVLERVTLIKDISLTAPHRAHIEILADLSFTALSEAQPCGEEITNFVTLHRAWQKTLDIQTLNKRFFIEIRNWFYWARVQARFPAGAKKDSDGRDSEALIRLLTRMIFCWFLREKGLLTDELFAAHKVETLLRDWTADDRGHDKAGRYYKAILQNLFFATLATPVAERKFRSARNYKGLNKHYGDQRYFRHVELFIEKAPVEELYKKIPFLNGGLFENLDEFPSEDNDLKEEVRVDGFSDVASKQPHVPDYLFFGDERSVPEIADLLGESSAPKARGLLRIFRDYKFTVEENTPLEQDIALDPELLGRTFENLLAAVNPETGTVARKSTGSFYTPREIVHYMVEEALVRYLIGAMAPSGASADLEEKVRELVSEEKPSHRLDREAERIVGLIGQLRILDPACGSGAFPMGLLQLLVHVLRKLDQDNKLWEATKLASLPPEMRKRAKDVFREETWDYSRKLELIKDCVHGVDIQPTAIQIAKLRFFLSLVIEQSDPEAVRPLPNLETKFVCANALLGLPRPQDWELFQHQIEPKERSLLEIRARYFFAETKEKKDACKSEDRTLRRDLSKFIEGIGGSAARQLASAVAAWDPYRSDHRAGYFDPESMFGIRDGFDITIGNPPYVRADEQSDWNRFQREQILASAQYETLWERWDLYVPFIERCFKLLRPGGVSTLIVSDGFCHSKYAQKPQNWFLKHSRILRLDFCGDVKIFDAAVHNVIFFFQRADGAKWKPERRVHRETFGEVTPLPTEEQAKLTYRAFFPEESLHAGFSVPTLPIGSICYVSFGCRPNSDEKLAKGLFVAADLVSETKDKSHPKPYIEAKDIVRWSYGHNRWLEWGTARSPELLARPTFVQLYEVPEKIVAADVSGAENRAAYDDGKVFHSHTLISFVPWQSLHGVRNNSLKKSTRYRGEKPARPDLPKREELEATSRRFGVKYLLGVMNSDSARDFLRANRRSNIHLYPDDWKKLPIPDVPAEQQQPVVQVVDLILAFHRYFHARPGHRTARDTVLLEFLENLNDALVRELYTPDELHARSLHFGRFVTEARLPKVDAVKDAEHLEKIRKALEAASDINTPLRAALFDLGSLTMTEQDAEAV